MISRRFARSSSTLVVDRSNTQLLLLVLVLTLLLITLPPAPPPLPPLALLLAEKPPPDRMRALRLGLAGRRGLAASDAEFTSIPSAPALNCGKGVGDGGAKGATC